MIKDLHSQEFLAGLEKLGIQNLRPQQEAPMGAILSGRDVIVKMPTGGGKSILFQAPAQTDSASALTLVISPLRALQDDQVSGLKKRGIRAARLNSDLTPAQHAAVLTDFCAHGGLLYLAPEQLQNPRVADQLCSANVVRIAVDEAHILAQAKDDFRKAYGGIGSFIQTIPHRPQLLALTATATRHDTREIITALGMREPAVFDFPIRRDNLRLSVKRVEVPGKKGRKRSLETLRFQAVERVLRGWNGKGSAIIYCPTVKMVRQLSKWLKARGYSVGKYHGKMRREKREKMQAAFMSGSRPVMVATNAFGLGIDKADVRLIIHAGLPLSMDGYVQEIGRAGRDGEKSRCVLIYAKKDISTAERLLRQTGGKKVVRRKLQRLHALCSLLESKKCLWRGIEKYFGQKKLEPCGHCSHCRRKKGQGH